MTTVGDASYPHEQYYIVLPYMALYVTDLPDE